MADKQKTDKEKAAKEKSESDCPKRTESYYLPSDVTEWIERQAKKDNRSASNYLATLIRKMRDDQSST